MTLTSDLGLYLQKV